MVRRKLGSGGDDSPAGTYLETLLAVFRSHAAVIPNTGRARDDLEDRVLVAMATVMCYIAADRQHRKVPSTKHTDMYGAITTVLAGLQDCFPSVNAPIPPDPTEGL